MKSSAIMMGGIALLVCLFGSYLLHQQIRFDAHAEELSAKIVSVQAGSRRGRSGNVKAMYVYNNQEYREHLQRPIFSTLLGLYVGKEVQIHINTMSPEEARLMTGKIDIFLFYMSGIFFILLGAVFGMFAVLMQKFGKE